MTQQEAIGILVGVIATNSEEENEALDLAIEALMIDIVRCKDCYYGDKLVPTSDETTVFCNKHERLFHDTDYCSYGEEGADE